MINGIVDLSHWNIIHDISLFKSWGANALITKATEGLTFKDDSYTSKKQVALDMSIPFGAYHFGRGFDGKQQADFFLSVVDVKNNPNTLLILDFEMSMTLKQAEDFVNEVYAVTQTYPAIYTRKTYMDIAVGTRDTILSKCPLWVAQYGESPNIPVQWTNYFLWQYTDGTYGPEPHVVPGVGNGDRSQYKGTQEELKTDWLLYSNPIVVGPPPIKQPVIIDVPYISQYSKEGDKFREDCGPACLDMILKWKAIKDGVTLDPGITINSLASESTLINQDTGITVANLVSVALKHALDVSESHALDMDAITAQIDAGKPVVSLIQYGFISGREDIGYTQGHFVVVNGYDDNNVYVNDPDWTLDKGNQAKNLKIPKTEFMPAIDFYSNNGMVFNDTSGSANSTRYVTATLLNVRSEAVIKNGNVLFQLKMGDKVEVNLNASQGQFVPLFKVNDVAKTGWISNSYLSSFPVTPVDPPVTPPTPPIIQKNTQKIGLHIMPGANNDLLMGLLMTKKIPGVTLIRSGWGGEMTVKAIKTVSPDTKVLLRWYADNWERRPVDWTVKDLASKGDQWVNDYFVNMIQNRDPQDSLLADYHQIINEPPFGPGTASFWMGALGAAKKRNIKLGIFCFSMGYPPLPNEANSPWSGYYDVMRQAKAEGHVLMLHEYTIPEKTGKWDEVWGIARHKQLYSQFPSDLKDMPLIIGEFGDRYGLARGNGVFMDNVKIAYNNMQVDTQIISANLWTFGGMGAWQSDLLDGATKDLQNWVVGLG